MEEHSRNELTQIHADQALFAKYGANDAKKVAVIECGQVEGVTRERFPYGGMDVNCCPFRSTTKESFSIVNHCSKLG